MIFSQNNSAITGAGVKPVIPKHSGTMIVPFFRVFYRKKKFVTSKAKSKY